MTDTIIARIMDVLLDCLKDDNVEVRQMAAKTLAGLLRCSKRSKIPELKVGLYSIPEPLLIVLFRIDSYALSNAPKYQIAKTQAITRPFAIFTRLYSDFAA